MTSSRVGNITEYKHGMCVKVRLLREKEKCGVGGGWGGVGLA
jgi:hypothetical protein